VALLDTTVLVDLGRRPDAPPHHRARTAVHELIAGGQTLFASRINEAEFLVGPEMSRDREKELDRVNRILAGIVILEFSDEAARHYAVIKSSLLKRGRPAGDCDMLIAAVALANGLPMLTRNPRHFSNIFGLVVNGY